MGSKEKFWVREPDGDTRWLFKYPRAGKGEHWAERIAAAVAGHLGLPHAHAELATYGGRPGVAVRDFTDGGRCGALVHGNELLVERDPEYPVGDQYRVKKHTLGAVFEVLDQPFVRPPSDLTDPPPGVTTASEVFAGYLLLDAVVGNTDRHHENWGVLEPPTAVGNARTAELAPTFDHASSLMREVDDRRREMYLRPADRHHTIAQYARKCRSALFSHEADRKPLSPTAAFRLAVVGHPRGAGWLDRLMQLPQSLWSQLVDRVPPMLMDEPARRLTAQLLEYRVTRLLVPEPNA